MSHVQQQSQQQISTILDEFALFNDSPKRQQDTFVYFLDILGHFAVIQEVTANHLMFGTFYIQVKAAVGEDTRDLTFFIPSTGGMVYRYAKDTKEKLSIYLNPRYIVEDKAAAIAAVSGSRWLALPSL